LTLAVQDSQRRVCTTRRYSEREFHIGERPSVFPAPSQVVVRVSVIPAETLGVELPRHEVTLQGVAFDARRHPVVGLVSPRRPDGDKMVNLPRPMRPDHAIVRKREALLTIQAGSVAPVV